MFNIYKAFQPKLSNCTPKENFSLRHCQTPQSKDLNKIFHITQRFSLLSTYKGLISSLDSFAITIRVGLFIRRQIRKSAWGSWEIGTYNT